uniref:Cysteine-rich and transmembrane domain-containing protein 1 isoform X3 n=1 Tax=Tursiops truncatus TaxID=9739 RepID=A0A6J3R351_TURTR|nr:cysteine-rich and transmembrane domain-containing protein 1 isoform X3 [Tursiops truncatus]
MWEQAARCQLPRPLLADFLKIPSYAGKEARSCGSFSLLIWPGVLSRSLMNQGNPPPYPGPGPTAPYPPYPQQPMGPEGYPPGPMGGPYPPPQGYPYQGYPQYGWPGGPQEPPKSTADYELPPWIEE